MTWGEITMGRDDLLPIFLHGLFTNLKVTFQIYQGKQVLVIWLSGMSYFSLWMSNFTEALVHVDE